jgi:DNA-binding PadR family transcriptional regulator
VAEPGTQVDWSRGCRYYVERYIAVRCTDDVVDVEMDVPRTGLNELGRWATPAMLILTSLAEAPKHGYAIAQDVERFADVSLGPGTLYGALARLEASGLIEAKAGDDRRQPYRITDRGRKAAGEQLRAMRAVAEAGLGRLGWA